MIADTPASPALPKLVLTDPLPALPPPWWQDRSLLVAIAAGLTLAIVTGFVIRAVLIRMRAKPAPGAVALSALENTGDTLAVTRVLRDYLAAVNPPLHTGLTVDEIALLSARENALPAEGWIVILRECDEAKYAGASAPVSLAERARKLVVATEKHLAEAAAKRR